MVSVVAKEGKFCCLNASDKTMATELEANPTTALNAARNTFARIPMILVLTMTASRFLVPAVSSFLNFNCPLSRFLPAFVQPFPFHMNNPSADASFPILPSS